MRAFGDLDAQGSLPSGMVIRVEPPSASGHEVDLQREALIGAAHVRKLRAPCRRRRPAAGRAARTDPRTRPTDRQSPVPADRVVAGLGIFAVIVALRAFPPWASISPRSKRARCSGSLSRS